MAGSVALMVRCSTYAMGEEGDVAVPVSMGPPPALTPTYPVRLYSDPLETMSPGP